jgi:hypothetical protein
MTAFGISTAAVNGKNEGARLPIGERGLVIALFSVGADSQVAPAIFASSTYR